MDVGITKLMPDFVGHDDDKPERLIHTFCTCAPYKGLCGADLDPNGYIHPNEPYDNDCIVCEDMSPKACPRCGN